jgi:hypothetical protein
MLIQYLQRSWWGLERSWGSDGFMDGRSESQYHPWTWILFVRKLFVLSLACCCDIDQD